MTDTPPTDKEPPMSEPEYIVEPWPPRQSTGGQHAGMGPQGVKVTHTATNLVACCDFLRSQHANREMAMHMIESALTHPRFR